MNRMRFCALVAAALALGGCTPPAPTPVFASIDLSCGNKTYTVSTGNNRGECQSSGQNAVCGDDRGNTTEVSCASGCMNAHGSASCQLKQ